MGVSTSASPAGAIGAVPRVTPGQVTAYSRVCLALQQKVNMKPLNCGDDASPECSTSGGRRAVGAEDASSMGRWSLVFGKVAGVESRRFTDFRLSGFDGSWTLGWSHLIGVRLVGCAHRSWRDVSRLGLGHGW